MRKTQKRHEEYKQVQRVIMGPSGQKRQEWALAGMKGKSLTLLLATIQFYEQC